MKRILYLLMAVAVLASCSKHEDLYTLPEGGTRTPMTISVADGGYTDSNPKSSSATRAVENGYTTEFTAGDKIGLYVVNPDGNYAHQNIALTLTDNGSGTLVWTPSAGTTLYYEGAAAKYFAYYPYSSLLEDQTPPTAAGTTPTDFFANLITAWNPATDQSSYALYTSQDLMVGSGTVSKQADAYTLAFSMTHAMALVVIETPMTKYTLTDKDSNPLPGYYLPAPDTKFYGFTPYSPTMGTYRLLVKPAQSGAPDLMGSYTAANGNTKEYAIAQNSISAANYVHSKVDGGITAKTHTLQAGDFYLKDGSLLGKDATLSDAQKSACLGIVYWVGDPTNTTNGDPLLKTQHSGCTHGLVVALHEAKNPLTNAAAKMKWSVNTENVNTWTNHGDRGANKVDITEQNRYQGYANTVALKAYNAQQSNADLKVLPIAAVEQYQIDNPAPSNSSGWYVPSIMELKYICWGQGSSESTAGRNLLNGQFAKVGGKNFDGSWNYWSSSELAGGSYYAWGVGFRYGSVNYYDKDLNEFWVRALFAF